MGDPGELRKSPRIQLQLTLLASSNDKAVECKAIDLSVGGICFVSNVEFKLDSKLYLTCPGVSKSEEEIEARLLRCQLQQDSSYKSAAIFLDPDLTYLNNLMKYGKKV